jgi:hypothetical protein
VALRVLKNCWFRFFKCCRLKEPHNSSSLKKFKLKEPVIFMKSTGKELGILLSGSVTFSDLLGNFYITDK